MTATTPAPLTDEERASWRTNGFFIRRQFDVDSCQPMLERVVEIVREREDGGGDGPTFVLPESNLAGRDAAAPEDKVSKVFSLHRDPVFSAFTSDRRLRDLLHDLLGVSEISCFLSQFIFKNPGAWGQPWHQDSYYFPFEPARPVVGAWLAVTAATLENGCLHVLAGSHHEPVHEHVPDRRPGANYAYVEIIDHDTSASEPVLMEPGDLLVFDSHLMHRSTDNVSDGIRAAMVFHFAATATHDKTAGIRGYTINDWVPLT